MLVQTTAVGPWPQGPPADASVPQPTELNGVLNRDLIAWHGGGSDTTTTVTWLQADGYYADLRQPAERPSFAGVSCLRELTAEHVGWMVRQEAFAGRLLQSTVDPAHYTWERAVDFSPAPAGIDHGTLHREGALLVERGLDLPYLELWKHTEQHQPGDSATLVLADPETGATALLLRTGNRFALVRPRPVAVERFLRPDELTDPDALRQAQDQLDCEVSLGTVRPDGWVIDRSTLPFKVGSTAAFTVSAARDTVHLHDLSPAGQASLRRWVVTDVVGDPSLLTPA